MSIVGEAFRHHHQALARELEDRSRAITDARPGTDLDGLVTFLKRELLGHAAGEERHLYPAVEPLLKAHGMATATMRVDHRFLEDYIGKVEAVAGRLRGAPEDERPALERELGRLVIELQALFRVHLAKEEQVYLPLFEQHVSADSQRQVMERMHEPVPSEAAPDVLDVRQMPPPQRHPLILRTFEALAVGQAFTLVNDHDPKPLYYQFQAELTGQFTWNYVEQGPAVWRVRIGRASAVARGAANAVSAFLASYREAASFSRERFKAVSVGQTDRVRVLLVCLEPGQFIPVHHPGVDFAVVVLDGEGRLVAGDREEEARAGTVALVPAGEARGMVATTRLTALTVVSPPPTERDHAEVAEGLRRGRWR